MLLTIRLRRLKFYAHVPGWDLHIPVNGLLFSEWDVDPLGMLLPNDRDIVDLRGEEVLRLHPPDDGHTIEQVLVHLLGGVRASDHGREYIKLVSVI